MRVWKVDGTSYMLYKGTIKVLSFVGLGAV